MRVLVVFVMYLMGYIHQRNNIFHFHLMESDSFSRFKRSNTGMELCHKIVLCELPIYLKANHESWYEIHKRSAHNFVGPNFWKERPSDPKGFG